MAPELAQAHCNHCGCFTNHDVVASEKRTGIEDESDDLSYELYEMLRCRGCESVSLRYSWRHSAYSEPDITLYPPAIARRAPEWAKLSLGDLGFADKDDPPPVPWNVKSIMEEVYSAVQNGLPRLAAMGIRAALENMMIDKIGDQGTFRRNVDEFVGAGYLSQKQKDHLNAALDAGHAATHRGWNPSDQEISTLLDIAESAIETAYLHGHSQRIEEERPPKTSKIGSEARLVRVSRRPVDRVIARPHPNQCRSPA